MGDLYEGECWDCGEERCDLIACAVCGYSVCADCSIRENEHTLCHDCSWKAATE